MTDQAIRQLYLMRHGDTGYTGRFVGATDIPLSAEGRQDVQAMRRQIEPLAIDKVVASPMVRCRETVAILGLLDRCVFSKELREIDFGHWEKLSFAEVSTRFPEQVRQWRQSPADFVFPGGESFAAFTRRITNLDRWIRKESENKLLIVSHGGVLKNLICSLLGIDLKHAMKFAILPGTVHTIDLFSEGGVLTGLNQRRELWHS